MVPSKSQTTFMRVSDASEQENATSNMRFLTKTLQSARGILFSLFTTVLPSRWCLTACVGVRTQWARGLTARPGRPGTGCHPFRTIADVLGSRDAFLEG